ncbi:hypothetical protein CI105_02590 [Candidatus Izimaplasma bacterium ZiA1]|uniref:GNAT family N-acetyltransferase n=1 Tax=Candidatus Izimoplasma sp. ZiA1 TaxID=2024899 RepID=UPI000BAA4151|nr:hypothetical protein CI105_02590 [Candidatus Izimaplasma bacterium ZiA1]
MEKINKVLQGKNIKLNLITENDFNEYYISGFVNMDEEVNYFTGSYGDYSKEKILTYVKSIVDDDTRYDYLIRDLNNKIIGEVVINEIDYETNSSSYRIAIFNSCDFNKGYGTSASKLVLDFCFDVLDLHRIELEVYSFNKRGIKVYKKLGFEIEGIRRDAYIVNNNYHDIIEMAILNPKHDRKSEEKLCIEDINHDFTSSITFLYFEDYENATNFFEDTLELKMVSDKEFAKIYCIGKASYIGIVKKASGSVKERVLISINTNNVSKTYDRLSKYDLNQTKINIIEQIPLKSFFFKGPENYDFEIQEFINKEDKIIFE